MGFEKTVYSVSEAEIEVGICAVVRNTISCYILFAFSISMLTVDGSAGTVIS